MDLDDDCLEGAMCSRGLGVLRRSPTLYSERPADVSCMKGTCPQSWLAWPISRLDDTAPVPLLAIYAPEWSPHSAAGTFEKPRSKHGGRRGGPHERIAVESEAKTAGCQCMEDNPKHGAEGRHEPGGGGIIIERRMAIPCCGLGGGAGGPTFPNRISGGSSSVVGAGRGW